ncbi:MAG: hypothetical protein EOS79_28945 [Mesorhizobium sp.]|nr:MAG: hypothetical protein EOS79_28945 [Mesorhizobium sp.]
MAADSFVILADFRAVIPYCRRRFGDGISGEVTDGLFGGGASPSCPELKGCAPEQPAVVDRGGSGRHEPADAARIGGMDRQTLRDWVHRFNTAGPDGLVDQWAPGPASRLSHEQQAELAALVEKGPDRAVDGVVRWRRIDLKKAIKDRFGIDYDARYVGKLLHKLGFSHMSVRPRHPAQDAHIIEELKKLASHAEGASLRLAAAHEGGDLVPDAMRAEIVESGGCPTSCKRKPSCPRTPST